MLRRSHWILLKVEAPREVSGKIRSAGSSAGRRSRQFQSANTSSSSGSRYTAQQSGSAKAGRHHQQQHHQSPAGRTFGKAARELRPGEVSAAAPSSSSFPNASYSGGSSPQASQRQRYREQQAREQQHAEREQWSAAASMLSPLPKKYGFYDGIDEHGVEDTRPSRESRRQMLQQALESQAASTVEFTEGGEEDIDRNGLPESEYHGQQGWTTIPKDSAMYSNVFAKSALESRQRSNTWGVARRQTQQGSAISEAMGEYRAEGGMAAAAAEEEGPSDTEVLDGARRQRGKDEGGYSALLEGELLESTRDSVGPPRSTYALRKMYVNGLEGYQGIISKAEEAQIAEELLYLLQDPRAAYVAEETRYCVNLYETELGIPGKDTLAFALARAPTLQRVLYRFFHLGLIPSPPNVCQVSEMIGNFSGYPVHRKPPSIGSYCGILNLVSTSVMHLQHRDCPWFPRVHMNPRSLFVVSEPCLSEYAIGYKHTHQPFHTFEYATRVSKDYRMEVLFATVETAHAKHLNEAVQLTAYAKEKMGLPRDDSPPTLLTSSSLEENPEPTTAEEGGLRGADESIDAWLERVRGQLHASEKTEGATPSPSHAVIDGNALRKAVEDRFLVGKTPQPFGVSSGRSGQQQSPAQRRLAALKARHDFAQTLKGGNAVDKSSDGPRLIRGHAPGDRKPL